MLKLEGNGQNVNIPTKETEVLWSASKNKQSLESGGWCPIPLFLKSANTLNLFKNPQFLSFSLPKSVDIRESIYLHLYLAVLSLFGLSNLHWSTFVFGFFVYEVVSSGTSAPFWYVPSPGASPPNKRSKILVPVFFLLLVQIGNWKFKFNTVWTFVFARNRDVQKNHIKRL